MDTGKPTTEPPPPASPPRTRIQFLPALRYIFEPQDWVKSLLFACVCTFIPIFGQIALYGFMYQVVESRLRWPQNPYPLFSFSRFANYCTRGVWVYIVILTVTTMMQLVLQLPLQFGIQGIMILSINNPQAGLITAAIGVPIVMLGLFVLAIGMSMLVTPVMLRAGLAPEFAQIFDFRWFRDFLRRVWIETLLAKLITLVTMLILMPLGLMLFCIGAIPMAVIIGMMDSHLTAQLYAIFLERGGEPIPLRPLPADAPPVGLEVPPPTVDNIAAAPLPGPISPEGSSPN